MRFDGYLSIYYTVTKTSEKQPVKIIADFDDSWLVRRRYLGELVVAKNTVRVLEKSKWYKTL